MTQVQSSKMQEAFIWGVQGPTRVNDALAHLGVTEGHAMPVHKLPQHVASQLPVSSCANDHHWMLGTLQTAHESTDACK